jgi:hypothetical protein
MVLDSLFDGLGSAGQSTGVFRPDALSFGCNLIARESSGFRRTARARTTPSAWRTVKRWTRGSSVAPCVAGADQRLKRLIGDLAVQSPRFVELWESDAPEQHQDFGRHKVIDHPDVGRITLDCDVLIVAADDLRIMIYTAEPETVDAERLALAIVLGTQAFRD